MSLSMQTQVETTVTAVRERSAKRPALGLILGSGLSSLADAVEQADIIPTDQLPHWPASTVAGHSGRLVIGELGGKPILVLQGRVHFYEGYNMAQITFPVRVLRALGVQTLIITNAAGGMNPEFSPGDLMLIKDHLNFPGMAGQNPLRGPNDEAVGPRFPDMTAPYDSALRQLAHNVARQHNLSLHEGVYACVAGPSYETPAELRFLRMAGGDAVGMSTVPTVVVARHAGMRVLGISTITNMAVPDPPPGTTLDHSDVLATGERVLPQLATLVHGIVRAI